MATQRLIIATLAGEAARATANRFASWRTEPSVVAATAVDRFCAALRANGASLHVVYFSEWIDRWLMGDGVPGPGAIEGQRFQVACFTREQAVAWAARCGTQFQEEGWLAARLREAGSAGGDSSGPVLLVVVREVLGGSALDEEILAARDVVPRWLAGD